jgi:hypothetical protein
LLAFLVELGALMRVASTIVSVLSQINWVEAVPHEAHAHHGLQAKRGAPSLFLWIPGRDALEQRGLRYYFFHLLQEYLLARFPDVQIEVQSGLFHGGISQTPLITRTQST